VSDVQVAGVVTSGTFGLDGGTWEVDNNVWVIGNETECVVIDAAVLTGDTLFHGGPGATGRSFSDFPTIIDSIREQLLTLPADTVVHAGHGDDTSIGAERGDLKAWITRGH